MTIPWLFQDLRAGKKSGTAVFEYDTIIKNIHFGNGDVLFASSNRDDDRLGEFLLKQGRISRAQFDAASAAVIRTKKKLGAVLFELGILQPKELVSQVKLQIKQIILSLFSWRDGRYRFEEGRLAGKEIIPLQMSTGNLILEGIQSLDWQIIRKALPPVKTILRPSTDPSLIFQNADLNSDQKAVLSLVDGARSIEQLCSLTGIGDFNTLKAVYLLLALRIAEAGELRSEKEKSFVRDALQEAAKAAQKQPHDTAAAAPVLTREMLQQAFEALNRQDHFEVLGISRTASAYDAKKAYFRLAKVYHPDRHFEPDMADMKETLEQLFSRIHDAYQVLNDPVRRREYEQQLTGVQPAAVAHFEEKRPEDYVENYAEKAGRATSYFNAGMKELKVGNYWGAAELFAWATRLDPVKAAYFHYYGLSLSHIPRRRHEAEENLHKAIEIDPLKPEYHLELGTLYLKSGLKSKALDIYLVALRENPGSEQIVNAIKAAGGEIPQSGDQDGGLFKKMFKDKKT